MVMRILPQLAVFAVLALIGWAGHVTHWTVPKRSALWGASSDPSPADAGTVRLAVGNTEFPSLIFASPDDVRRAKITTTQVVQHDLDEFVTANAVVDYDRSRVAQLAPRTAGRVAYVFKRLGDPVAKGEVLALFDSEEVGRAKADFLQEAGIAAHRSRVYSRLTTIGTDVLAENTIREAEAAVREAKLRRFAAHQKLINLGISADLPEEVALSPEEMAKRLQFAGIADEVIAKLNPKPRTANLIALLAPFDGVVIKMDAVVGEMERPDHPAMTVADVSRMWVWLSVRKEDAGSLALGQPVELQFERRTLSCSGRITWVSTEVDQKTRTLQTRVDVDNPHHRRTDASLSLVAAELPSPRLQPTMLAGSADCPRELMANMFGTGRVHVARVEDALLVPDASVQTLQVTPNRLRKLVFVACSDGVTFESRVVELGRSRDGVTHIIEGLRPKEFVVVSGSYVLKSELMLDSLSGGVN